MKTLATFLPRLAGAGYVPVSTCRLCSEAEPTPAFTQLCEALQALCTLFASLRREEDIRRSVPQVLRAVRALRQAERAYFFPVSVTTIQRKHHAESLLPDWALLCNVRARLAPLSEATDAEIRRLMSDAALQQAVSSFLRYPRGAFMVEDEEWGNPLFEQELPETGPVLSVGEKRFESFMARLRTLRATIAGGNGLTRETAIVLKEQGPDVIGEEYDLFRKAYGGSPDRQYLVPCEDRRYDVLVRHRDAEPGHPRECTLWFDITAYWNRFS